MTHDTQAIDTAWRIHQANADWTGKVDAKASFIFAIASASIATTVALTADGRIFHDIDTWWLQGLYWLGLAALIVGVFFSSRVVVPRLRNGKLKKESADHFIYFGHVRHLTPQELEGRLREKEILPVLSKQIVEMARISWRKHKWAQFALWFTITGAALEAFVALARTMTCFS